MFINYIEIGQKTDNVVFLSWRGFDITIYGQSTNLKYKIQNSHLRFK